MTASPELRKELEWLASNWDRKGLANLSAYNAAFYSALQNILDGRASEQDLALLVEGTLGRIADGYAHLLDVDPRELVADPWLRLRRLGEISKGLKKLSTR